MDNSVTVQKKAPKHQRDVAKYLLAKGLSVEDVSSDSGMSVEEINQCLTEERFNFDVKALRHRLYGEDTQTRFKILLPEAIDTTAEIMKDQSVKPGVRLSAAKEILDRNLGKPTQHINVQGSILSELYDRLQKEGTVIDVYPQSVVKQVAQAEVERSVHDLERIKKKIEDDKKSKQDYIEVWTVENI